MANLKEIRLRITSVKSTQQVTSAMKMVSAAKLRRAQDAIIQLRPYAAKLQGILAQLSENIDSASNKKYGKREHIDRVLIVAVTSNRGLCGGFNANVVKKINELIRTDYAELYKRGRIDIMAIGKKANDGLKSRGIAVNSVNIEIFQDPSFANVSAIAESIMEKYADGTYDKVLMVYNQFKNAAVQNLLVEQLLPAEITVTKEVSKERKGYNLDYFYEPTKESVIEIVIPKSIKTQVYKVILDSIASEHGARMTAMHKATDNAAELIKNLNLTYNKARQASITNEILEIVGGANALKG